MKFVDTIKTDITWLVVQGMATELDKLIAWTDRHRTAYVIAGKRTLVMHESGNTQSILNLIRSKQNGTEIYTQRFGFKAASDALRCKLTLA